MLRHAPKGAFAEADSVTPEEDAALRVAFGRFGGHEAARRAAMPVVARYQQRGGGRWLLCDCRPGAERPPALIPVAMTHVRRHDDPRWARHAEGCDFNREPAEQLVITASHLRPSSRAFRLARRFVPITATAMLREFKACSQASKRPGLARLLMRLVTDAGLQEALPGWRPPPLPDQVKAIWTAARPLELDEGVRLTEFLCTNLLKLPELVERLRTATAERFKHTRPHGILLARLAAVGEGTIKPFAGPALPVSGRLAVFGEDAADAADATARAPYLAACMVGQAEARTVRSASSRPMCIRVRPRRI